MMHGFAPAMITAEAVAGNVNAGTSTVPKTFLAMREAAIPEVQLFAVVMTSSAWHVFYLTRFQTGARPARSAKTIWLDKPVQDSAPISPLAARPDESKETGTFLPPTFQS
jgi:hypothetical protein